MNTQKVLVLHVKEIRKWQSLRMNRAENIGHQIIIARAKSYCITENKKRRKEKRNWRKRKIPWKSLLSTYFHLFDRITFGNRDNSHINVLKFDQQTNQSNVYFHSMIWKQLQNSLSISITSHSILFSIIWLCFLFCRFKHEIAI